LASISALTQQAFQNWWPKKQDLDDVAFKTASRSLHPCLHRSLHPSLQTDRGKEKNDRAAWAWSRAAPRQAHSGIAGVSERIEARRLPGGAQLYDAVVDHD
jgi:hypothetical protein